ncbi:LDH2 family malate/lactate/ureidoglycolate dehydrogenase [Salirhabdus euzebyi]|uniref:LDH2 family malate/lactate/ureidoglycolate dehydrogenase n=1 Tax=Salirhabdus euzebyi TaxID=394506 RepID=A0A841Q5L6_9BACI|nr:Ldh family oxidoreductase [Salirhabdus euzebyi]MBB6453674.1 LDH2 family malate/lactate/ureidoglycolate dehydrogenase [Salirhabdus euzebyi]
MPTYQAEDLKQFGQHVFEAIGVEEEYARVAADALVRANLEGVDSHGISRLGIYAKRMNETKTINANPNIKVEKKGESVLLVDGDNGLGQITSYVAIQEGIKLAKKTGVAAIGVRNSNHFGTASYFCQKACEENVAAMAFTNSPPGIAPWGGIKPFFGTNPIAFGFPTDDEKPVIIDMSTSVVARGKIILAAKQDESIPKGWAIDSEGVETEDPNEALQGAVLPVGGAKGYALALAVEILTGVLSGAAFGPNVKNIYSETVEQANVGHFFILMDVEKFMPIEQFQKIMEIFLEDMKEMPKQDGVDEILYPGERRNREYTKRLASGITISEQVKEELQSLATAVQVDFPKERVNA